MKSAAEVHGRARARTRSRLHGPVERLFALMAQPAALYVLVAPIFIWITVNLCMGRHSPDPAPFFYLQSVIGMLALITTVSVLIVQEREGRLARTRVELELQINLLAEQKVTKLIQLIEELRHDLPNVRNRQDLQALDMQKGTDPASVLDALEKREDKERRDQKNLRW